MFRQAFTLSVKILNLLRVDEHILYLREAAVTINGPQKYQKFHQKT